MISDDQIQRMCNAPPREVCEHGSQKVKCVHCDNIALKAEIAALRSQIDDLRAGQANDDRDHRVLTERAERAEAERDALLEAALRAVEDGWRPIETAPHNKTVLGVVDGETRLIRWGKASHVPIYGWCLADQGAEDFDICRPTLWQPKPLPPKVKPIIGDKK